MSERCIIFNPVKILILSLIWWSCGSVCGQKNMYIRNFTTDNGLPNNSIRSITQDQTGFLWIGTWDGLSRYDGYEFKNYYHRPGDSASLPYFTVLKVYVNRYNQVWVLTENRCLCRYNRANDTFIQFRLPREKNGVVPAIDNMALDTKKNIWIISSNTLYQIDGLNNIINSMPIVYQKKQLPENALHNDFIIDNKDHFWMINIEVFKCEITVKKNVKTLEVISKYSLGKNSSPSNLAVTIGSFTTVFESVSNSSENYTKMENVGWTLVNYESDSG